MYLTINSPDKQLFEGQVAQVTLPGSNGNFQVLKDHAPMITTLRQGNITYRAEGKAQHLVVNQGLVEVLNNQITVLVEANSIS